MEKLLSDFDLTKVYMYKGYLEDEGIETSIMNEFGVLPMSQAWPELWVLHNEDYDRAAALIEELNNKSNKG